MLLLDITRTAASATRIQGGRYWPKPRREILPGFARHSARNREARAAGSRRQPRMAACLRTSAKSAGVRLARVATSGGAIELHYEAVNLTDTDLSGASLAFTLLGTADLRGADMTDADLIGADLYAANLTGVLGWDTVNIEGVKSCDLQTKPRPLLPGC